jgi:hypothetical protein
MKYSLINIVDESNGVVSGYWLQNVQGSHADAVEVAQDILVANSGKISIAIVDELPHTTPHLNFHSGLKAVSISRCYT